MNETIVVIKDDDINPTRLTFIADSSYDRYDYDNVLSVDWYVDEVFYDTAFIIDYDIFDYKSYNIKADFKINGEVFFSSTKTIDISVNFNRNFDFSVSKRYGPTPLTVEVRDTTDYSKIEFVPKFWTWGASGMGTCSSRMLRGINYRRLTFPNEGIYSIRMTVSDGINSYSVLKKDIIFVQNNSNGMQIELAEQTGENNRRHLIKSTHNEYDNNENRLEFYIWGSEVQVTELPTNKLMEINKEKGIITKNTLPFIDNMYDIGSTNEVWKNIFLSKLNTLNTTSSKILILWGGK